MKYSLQVILVYLTVFIDSVGNSIVYPIIPFLAKELGGSEQELGILYSSYSLTQTFSMSNMHLGGRAFILSLRCRRLCDGLSFWYIWTKALPCTEFIRFLGRYEIDCSQRGNFYDSISIVGPILQALSPNMTLYIITRGLTGLLGGSVTVGQAYLADCIPPEERSTALARLTGVAAFAFIFGPIIGGIFGQASYRLP